MSAARAYKSMASIQQAARQRLRQPERLIARLQKQRAAVRAAIRLVEAGNHRLRKQILEEHRLSCGIVHPATAFLCRKVCLAAAFLTQPGLLFIQNS
jgi:hypothetical protein